MKIFNMIRGLFSKMGIFNNAKSILKTCKFPSFDDYYKHIGYWLSVYKGEGDWTVVPRGGINGGVRKINRMNAAKLVCNELLNLTFSEQIDISISDEKMKIYVDEVLQNSGFWSAFPELLERFYALGGAAIKAYSDGSKIKLDFVPATRFIPLEWDDVRITGCIFVSSIAKNDKYYSLYEKHSFSSGTEIIENHLFKSDNKDAEARKVNLSELFPELPESITISGLSAPTFVYFKPHAANNIDFDTPLGVSVFANALDTLKSLDIVFDSLQREYILGKKRIIVPVSATRKEFDVNGKARSYFDTSDEVYQAFSMDDSEKLQIFDNTVELRITEHIEGINMLLDVLCAQVGLSTGTLSFDSAQGIKTATEVISLNSKTYRTVEGHQNLIREAIESIITAIVELSDKLGILSKTDYKINVKFDDSIITDKNTDIENAIKLNAAGLMSKVDAMIKIFGYDENTAKRKSKEITDEKRVGADALSLFNKLS